VAAWTRSSRANAAQEAGNTFLRFTPQNGAAEASRGTSGVSLAPYEAIRLRVNLRGATLLGGDASALYLDQGGSWKYRPISSYVVQGSTQWQTVTIPLSAFSGFNKSASFSRLGFRFWMSTASTIDVDDITFIVGPISSQLTLEASPVSDNEVEYAWLVSSGRTQVFSISDDPLRMAQSEERFSVFGTEDGWALAIWEEDPPTWPVWVALESLVPAATIASAAVE
jgi:hypothetical protein